MMQRFFQIVFICITASLLSLPAIRFLYQPTQTHSIVENRALASGPEFPTRLSEISNQKDQLENYLNDQLGFRDWIIQNTNQLKYTVFNEIISDQVSIGKNGFLYLNTHGNDSKFDLIKSVCGENPPSVSTLERMSDGVNAFLSHFKQFETKVAVAIIPTKSKIYPEHLPDVARHWCLKSSKTWLDLWAENLPQSDIIYPLSQYMFWKQETDVYLPKHFHWNGSTPYRTAQLILTHWDLEQEVFPEISEKTIESDLKNHLSGLQFFDLTKQHAFHQEDIQKCSGKDCLDGFTDMYARGTIQSYSRPSSSGNRLLILSDSFGPGIAYQMQMGFSEIYAINLNHLQSKEESHFFQRIFKAVQPSHVLYVMHDGGVVWQSLRLNRMFSD